MQGVSLPGADIQVTYVDKDAPLHEASLRGHEVVVKLLVDGERVTAIKGCTNYGMMR